MKTSQKCQKTRNGNTHKNSASTQENPVSTSKVSTRTGRNDMRYPEISKMYRVLDVDHKGDRTPKWRLIDAIITRAEENTADHISEIFDEFVSRIAVYYPDKRDAIERLRAFILYHILDGDELPEAYWKKLRELLP